VEVGGGDDDAPFRELADLTGVRYPLDYAHSLPRGAELERVMRLHDLVAHIHAKPARPGWSKAFAHRSATDWPRIVADLRARDWDGAIVVECIAYPVEDPRLERAAFIETELPHAPAPIDPGPVSHPALQTAHQYYHLALALAAAEPQRS